RPPSGVWHAAQHRSGDGGPLRAWRRQARDARRTGGRPARVGAERPQQRGGDPGRRALAGVGAGAVPVRLTRRQYADRYGPAAGDRVRLADTDLLILIERDLTTPGEEAKFGGGKGLRDGMGQSARATRAEGALDTVITNAIIIDHWGIVKADIGIRDGRIAGIGKAGNPDLRAGVTAGMVIGAGTEVIAGEGRIVTAGGLDSHIHLICPQIVNEAISAGLTTLVGGGTGPATGTAATTCTPGEWNIHRM